MGPFTSRPKAFRTSFFQSSPSNTVIPPLAYALITDSATSNSKLTPLINAGALWDRFWESRFQPYTITCWVLFLTVHWDRRWVAASSITTAATYFQTHCHETLIAWHTASVVLNVVALGLITRKNYASCSTLGLWQAVHSILQMICAPQSSGNLAKQQLLFEL